MRRLKTQAQVEAEGLGAAAVRCELDEVTALPSRLGDRVFEQRFPYTAGPLFLSNPHPFNLRPPATLIGEMRNEGQLQNTYHSSAEAGYD